MKKSNFIYILAICSVIICNQANAQEINSYKNYDFVAGEKIIFEDNLVNEKLSNQPITWTLEGGKALVEQENDDRYVSIKEYYTVLSPKLKNMKSLPDTFTIEYDTWLDAGYDGNPGVEILLVNGEQNLVVTPNRDHISCRYPGGEENGETPAAIRGENFYNRWNHISISYLKKTLVVYVNQFKIFSISNCNLKPSKIKLTGNTSQEMKILFKNFRFAKNIPNNNVTNDMQKGKFVTHAIRFDVNKAELKPESMSVLTEIVKYLKANASVKIEIGGFTDADGDDAANLKLSQARADAVMNQLLTMGIPATQLSSKGFGEAKPIDNNTSAEGKANNRRVEFVKLN